MKFLWNVPFMFTANNILWTILKLHVSSRIKHVYKIFIFSLHNILNTLHRLWMFVGAFPLDSFTDITVQMYKYRVFHSKHNRFSSSICKLWWHQYNNFFFNYYLLGSTYRTALHLSTLPDAGHVSCRKHFLCPEILLSVGVLLSYSALPCQNTHC
jgi:hypothetical protein